MSSSEPSVGESGPRWIDMSSSNAAPGYKDGGGDHWDGGRCGCLGMMKG